MYNSIKEPNTLWFPLGFLTPCCEKGKEGGPNVPNYPYHTDAEILNPMDEYTFDVLDHLYEEIIEDFPDEYVHLGMDEAYHHCWWEIYILTINL